MSLKNVENPEKNLAVLEISVDKETFDAACEKAYRKNVGKIMIPGFRKGKAPKKMIEKAYGANVFYEDAVDLTYVKAYEDALAESKTEPVGKPEFDIKEISENGYTFTVKVNTKPEASVKDYIGIQAEYEEPVVTDQDIADEMERRRQHNGQLVPVEREIKKDDTAVIDFEGFLDGKPFEGGKGENFNLKIGSGQFIPGFEEQLEGKKAGEDAELNVTFPEEYQAKELAGKPVVFKVSIKEVKENVLPEMDDEFAKDISEYNTLEELRTHVKEKMIENRAKASDNAFENSVIDGLIANMECDIPEVMFEEELEHITEDYSYRMKSQGMSLEQYLSMSGMDMDSFKKTFRPQAERRVKTTLALEAIAKAEKLEASADELAEEYKKMAEEYSMKEEEVKKYVAEDKLTEDLLTKKALELIKNAAVKKAPEEKKPEEQPAAKKPTAKKTAKASAKANTGDEAEKPEEAKDESKE